MFDDINEQITAVLRDRSTAPTLSQLKDEIDEPALTIEQAVKMNAETTKEDGETYVVSTDDFLGDLEPAPDSQQQAAQAVESDPEDEADEVDSAPHEPDEAPTVDVQDVSEGEEMEAHIVGRLLVDVDPQRKLAGQPTGQDVYGARKLTNSHPDVPNIEVPYQPAEIDGVNRDTEDLFYRAVGQDLPIILEGEHGTGKNQLARSAAATLNLPMYRQEFGSDTSVFDVVGEKEIRGENTVYILGKAAKAAMFGGLYIADEINMASGSVTSYLHPLFERRGSRELELRGTGVTLRDLPPGVEWDPEEHLGEYIHPDFHAIGTCNPLHYADTQPMNDALRSRCMVIEHPYLAEAEDDTEGIETEAELVSDETGADPTDVVDLVRAVAVIRQSRREGNVPKTPVGHRELRDTVEMAGPDESFMSFKEAAKIKIVGQASLKQDKKFIADTLEDEL